jgi:hypothetical protein
MKGEDPCWKDYKMVGTKKGKGGKEVPNCVPEETEVKSEAYNKDSVDKAIKTSRQKIGGREAKMIHALLKGRGDTGMGKYDEKNMKVNESEDDGWYTHNEMHGKISKENWKKGWRYNQNRPKPFYHEPTRKWHGSIVATEGYMPPADEPTDEDKKKAQKVLALLAKEKKPVKRYTKEEADLDEAKEPKMVYKKMLGQHTVYKGNELHRSFPTEIEAMNHIRKSNAEATKKTFPNVKHGMGEEVNEAKAESPIKGTRKISVHQGKDGHHAEVRHNPDWNEFQVHHYENGKHMGEGPVSYHDTKAEAQETAEHEVKNYRPKGGSLRKEEVQVELKEISNKTKLSYLNKVSDKARSTNPRQDLSPKRMKYVNKAQSDLMAHWKKQAKDNDAADAQNVLDRTPKVHDLRHMSHGEVYDHTQTSDKIRDGDVLHVKGGAAIMYKAWPTMVHGDSKALHSFDTGKSWDDKEVSHYKRAVNIAKSLKEEVELDEKLIGKQHKLDKNKNGKLDKQDFKLLRKEKPIDEKLNPSMGSAKYIDDFVKSKDPRFEGKTKKERIKMALGAYYSAKNEAVETEEVDTIEEAKYGEKRDYSKHYISVDGKYVASTTWARNAKEAEKKFIEQHPEHKNARITVAKER